MMPRWLIAPGMLIAAPLAAQQTASADPIVLWGEFTTATPKAKAKAFMKSLPKRQLAVIPGCAGPFGYRSGKGGLVTVTFMASLAAPDCFDRLRAQFEAEMGEPERGTASFGSVIGYGNGGVLDTTSAGLMLTWRQGVKKTKLIRTPGGGYNLIFTVREDKYLY
ncbi:MAG: hypothetical protein NBV68_08595 [Erythrobacter sp.]|uniref:hypothetical protein n=1 Tax=Erythrobacter sp. TaxID=1042 RepID=UPI0025D98F70|nr:hypothetical protein [Erythrobacter sp.]MCL9999426.1 hypothetical protein [Erythrobacter sp.]